MRITALSVGSFQVSEPYPSLAVTRVRSSNPCSLRSRTTVVARQSRRREHQHDADLAQDYLRRQALESGAVYSGASGAALIFVDDLHATRRPAQLDGPLAKVILSLRAFTILLHLQPGRLPYVDKGDSFAVCALNLGCRHQGCSFAASLRR